MKKLFALVLAFMLAIMLVGCSFIPLETEEEPDPTVIPTGTIYTVVFDMNGGDYIAPIAVKEGNVAIKPTNPVRTGFIFAYWYFDDVAIEYDFETPVTDNMILNAFWVSDIYDISNIPTNLLYYLGDSSYNHISSWFETDYNLDGEIDEEELEWSYEDMFEAFAEYGLPEEDFIITLTLEDVSNMVWGIDENMPQEYIDAAIYAIEYYDAIEWIDTSYVLTSDLSQFRFTFTIITQEDLYDQLYESYIDEGYEETLADEMATSFSTNVIAFNSLGIDTDNENFNTYDTTSISFIVESMVDLTQSEKNFVALHEMSHSFGLDDIYDEAFIGYTIMYGAAEGQDELLPTLRPFDLYNLAYIYYKVIQDEETSTE